MEKGTIYLKVLFILFAVFSLNSDAYARPGAPATELFVDGAITESIDENAVSGTHVGTITSDGLPFDSDTYALGCAVSGVDDGYFQIAGDSLQSAAVFNFENPVDDNNDNNYQICIRAENGSGTFDQNITVSVNDLLDDDTPPVITLNGDATVSLTVGETYTDEGATCTDDVDPTCTVVTVNPVDDTDPGTYTVTYNAQDDAGNNAVEVTRKVTIEKEKSKKTSSRRRLSRAQIDAIFNPRADTKKTLETESVDEKKTEDEEAVFNTCSELLMENLKISSRDGMYDNYTGAVVTQASLLQKHLNRLGFNVGIVDGIIGSDTEAAIREFQSFFGLDNDGYVGPKTRAIINISC